MRARAPMAPVSRTNYRNLVHKLRVKYLFFQFRDPLSGHQRGSLYVQKLLIVEERSLKSIPLYIRFPLCPVYFLPHNGDGRFSNRRSLR